uniref:TACC_C domain-containing protein n=1 Tax=Panagrellus redivivus TaxID=6233 RepID=A0A7E4WB10_PANRE
MVKTPNGRKPGAGHKRVLQKLRLRRANGHLHKAGATRPVEAVSSLSSEVAAEMPVDFIGPVGFVPIQVEEDVCKVFEMAETTVPIPVIKQQPALCVKKGVSDVQVAAPSVNVDRSTASESHIPRPFIGPLQQFPEPATTTDPNRRQRADELTDNYLAHLFSVSQSNLTSTQEASTSESFARLRNLFSDPSDVTEGFSKLRNLFSSDTQVSKAVNTSDSTLGLNTLFNGATAGKTLNTSDSSLGLNTLFNSGKSLKSTESTLGLNTLFNGGKKFEQAESVTDLPHSPVEKAGCAVRELTTSTSLLGNLFSSKERITDEEQATRERKKALIAKDFADYLRSDDERTDIRSQSLSTFVREIEALFERYRVLVAEVDSLRAQLAAVRGEQ